MKVPGFGDIGKATGDLLNKGYDFKNTITLNSTAGDGTKMTAKAVISDKAAGDIKLSRTCAGINMDVAVTSASKVTVTSGFPNLYPGLKATVTGNLPDHTSGKVTLDYTAPHLTTKTVVGLTSSPKLDFAATTGSSNVVVGTDLSYDTAKSAVTKWTLGAAYISKDYKVGCLLADKGDTLKASYCHVIDSSASAACELVRKLNNNSTTFTLGYQKKMENGSTFKTKLDNAGICAVSLQTEVQPKTILTVATQFDTTNLDSSTKIGFGLDMKA